jgi:methyl-accepting chemotaxis protein
MSTTDQRRIVLIDRRFQLRMAASFVFLHVLLTGLFAGALYLFMDSEIHASLASAHASNQSMSQMLVPIIVILSAFSVTLSMVLVTTFVVLLSHKIAGPMYRFRSVLDALAHRRLLAHANIRPGDQLGELSTTLGLALEVVNADVHNVQQSVIALRTAQQRGDVQAMEQALAHIEGTLHTWKQE